MTATQEDIILHHEMRDGKLILVDQHGRKLSGVKNMAVSCGVDEITSATVSVDLYEIDDEGNLKPCIRG